MKFSHTLTLNSNPEWAGKYVDYDQLKKLVNKLGSQNYENNFVGDDIIIDTEILVDASHDSGDAADNFYIAVERETLSVRSFYHQKRKELDFQFAELCKQVDVASNNTTENILQENTPLLNHDEDSDLEQIRKDMCDLYVQFHNLRTYVHLNCTAIRKIVKKYDKVLRDSMSSSPRMDRLKALLPWDGCPGIQTSMEYLVSAFARFFCKGNLMEAERRMNILLREFVAFQQRSVWLDVNEVTRKRDAMKMTKYEGTSKGMEGNSTGMIESMKSRRDVQVGIIIFGVFIGVLVLPGVFDEDPVKRNALALFVISSLLWATEVLPLFVTSMLVPFLSVVLRVFVDDDDIRLKANDASKIAFASMFSHVIMLLLGSFCVASALTKHGVAKLAATFVSRQFGANIRTVLLVNMFIATFASMWMSNVAAPVLCMSLIEPILKSSSAGKAVAQLGTEQWKSSDQDGRLCRALILGIALASNVGGMASPISSPQNLFAIEYAPIGWTTWLAVSLPLCVALDVLLWAWLVFSFDLPSTDSAAVEWALQGDRCRSEKLTARQIFVVVVSVGSVGLWCMSRSLSAFVGQMGILGIIPFVAFFGTGTLSKEDLNSFMWGVVLLAMGGLVLGEAIKSSGLLAAIAGAIANFVESRSLSPWGVIGVFTSIVFFFANFLSHTVAAIVFLPVAQALGNQMVPNHATELVFSGALACSTAMALPVSGFPNMTAVGVEDKLGKPYLTAKDFMRYALPASVMAWATIISLAYGLILLVL